MGELMRLRGIASRISERPNKDVRAGLFDEAGLRNRKVLAGRIW